MYISMTVSLFDCLFVLFVMAVYLKPMHNIGKTEKQKCLQDLHITYNKITMVESFP